MKPQTWAMLCHLGELTGYCFNGLGSVVVPLVLWILKKDKMPEVNQHGKEALNFNISILIYVLVLFAFNFLTLGIGTILAGPLLLVLVVFHIVCVLCAAIKANSGEDYQYPLCLRLVK